MRRSIFIGIISVSVVIALLLSAVSGLMLHRVVLDVVKRDVIDVSDLMHQEVKKQLASNQLLFDGLVDSELRLTIIDHDGAVLFDSQVEISKMDNHRDREEIRRALDVGFGSASRYSVSTGKTTYYYARRLNNGFVMRLAKSTESWFAILSQYVPLLIFAVLLIGLLAFLVSSRISQAIIKPLETLALRFSHGEMDVPYQELVPFQKIIEHQRAMLNEQMNELQSERDKTTDLMNHMNEGFLILDLQRRILTINEAAIHLLKARLGTYINKNVLTLTRNAGFLEALDVVLQGENQSRIVEIDGKSIRLFMSSIMQQQNQTGVMVFMMDVSELIRLDKVRREFTSNVSHELKTPLTSISGFAEMIHSDLVVSLEDAKRFAGRIEQEAARLITMVNEILRLSQIEEAKAKEYAAIDLNQLIVEVIDQLTLIAKSKKILLHYQEVPLMFDANRDQMSELIFNLVDNAIRYSHEGSDVTIRVEPYQDVVQIRVQDAGIGIASKYHDRIFERFFTVDKSHSKQSGGTGLGLSIVKHIVEYHRGMIEVDSEVGVGTQFVVTLPRKQR